MRDSKWIEILKKYILNNYKEYILVFILFIIGILLGVLMVNNCSEVQITEISEYINNFGTKFKQIDNIDKTSLAMTSLRNNTILAVIIWIAGTTVIGLPIVLVTILGRGLILGYTISAITCTYGLGKGILFCLISIFLQNLLFIPALLTLGVSSIKLYKSIIKNREKKNIKLEIIRHTIISILMILLFIISSFVENFISIEILQKFIKYF